jgi:hypothetical protein
MIKLSDLIVNWYSWERSHKKFPMSVRPRFI